MTAQNTSHEGLKTLYQGSVFLRKLLDSSPDGIVSADMTGRILLFNRGAEQILGYDREEAVAGINVACLFFPNIFFEMTHRMQRESHTGTKSLPRQEMHCVAKDGSKIPITLSGGIISNESGIDIAMFFVFRDQRPIQEIRNQLIQSEKMAGLGRMAAGVAHELNNPLSGIMLYAGLAMEKIANPSAVKEYLEIVISESDRCKQIIADLLGFSQPCSGKQEPLQTNDIIKTVVETLKLNPSYEHVLVRYQLEDNLPRMLGDTGRLKQVYFNIILNALQAMQGRGILTLCTRSRAQGNTIEIFISDTGPGIAHDVQDKIFDPFFTTKFDQGGTGLGLSLTYAIIKENRGTIRVESKPGSGTTFVLFFPTTEPNEAIQALWPNKENYP